MIRVADIVLSLMAIIGLSPVLIICAMVLKFTGEGEIIYVQKRIGRNKAVFGCFKFATMVKDSEKIGTKTLTVQDDPRVLPVGKILRKYKLNELPQLGNILLGQMSVIGPRPLVAAAFNQYPSELQDKISTYSPGLSGIGSLVFRDEERLLDREDSVRFYEDHILPYKAQLEEWFFQNRNIKTYFLLIILTIICLPIKGTKLPWRVFKSLPHPKETLGKELFKTD